MIIKINTLSQIPLYLQLRNQIVKGIGKGELTEGESLPTVRQMVCRSWYQYHDIEQSLPAFEK